MAGLQPPARSWFRLASIARMEAAEAAAAASTALSTTTPTTPPLPRTPIPRPLQPPTSPQPPPPPPQQPPTPPTQPPPPPSPPRPSPAPQAEPQPELPFTSTPQPEIKTQIATEAAPPSPPSPYEPQQMPYQSHQPPTPPRTATPPESPKVIKPSISSPPPSPTVKQTNNTHNPEPEPEPETKPPPPPLHHIFSALPEEKTITNSNGSRASNVSYSKLQGPPTKEEKKLRVITMAGENTGAVMEIGSAAPHRLGHLFHKADGNGHGRKMEQENDDSKKGGEGAAKTKHMEAVVNSNVQGINNSIVLNSTTTQHSPGVHITFASNRKPKGSGSSSSHKAHHSDHLH